MSNIKTPLCKVVCICNTYESSSISTWTPETSTKDLDLTYTIDITINKQYDVYEKRYLGDTLTSYVIINDNNVKGLYSKTLFKSLEDIRDEKLELIGI